MSLWSKNFKMCRRNPPFTCKSQPSSVIGISRNVITYYIDTWKPEGVKGTYLFSRQLYNEHIEKLIESTQPSVSGKKLKVWAYIAQTLKLINGLPFTTLLLAAHYFSVNTRTIRRHLDTKLSIFLNKTLVYFFQLLNQSLFNFLTFK